MALLPSEKLGGGNYSKSETKIGTWYNGKPRYRKIIESDFTYIGGSTTQEFVVDTGISKDTIDIKTVIGSYIIRSMPEDTVHQSLYSVSHFTEYGIIKGKAYTTSNNVQISFKSGATPWSGNNVPIKFISQLEYCYL